MIMFAIKIVLYFSLSFTILCLPINKKPLFNTLYGYFGQRVLQTVDQIVTKGKSELFPKIVQLIKSDPGETKSHLPANYSKAFFFSDKKYTAEEKNLMIKVLNKN